MKNEEYLKTYNPDKYDKLSLTVDGLIFTIIDGKLKICLVDRKKPPFEGMLAIPGTFVKMDESLEQACKRVLKDKAGFEDIYIDQLYAWGRVDRDPRMRIVSVSYISILSEEKLLKVRTKEEILSEFYDVDAVLSDSFELAFDHKEIVTYARKKLARDVEKSSDITFEFVSEKFTLPTLQKVHEILLGRSLYKANFRKKIAEYVVETDEKTSGEAYRPSILYVKAK